MIITIKGEPQANALIYTVSLVPDETGELHLFHCIKCGQATAQYTGRVGKIYPVLEPYAGSVVITRCPNCRARYGFQEHRFMQSDVTRVLLHTDGDRRNQFFCHAGRGEPMLVYNGQAVYSAVEKKTKQLPFLSSCSKPDCPELYYFIDMV